VLEGNAKNDDPHNPDVSIDIPESEPERQAELDPKLHFVQETEIADVLLPLMSQQRQSQREWKRKG
jgi:hypothetical protein